MSYVKELRGGAVLRLVKARPYGEVPEYQLQMTCGAETHQFPTSGSLQREEGIRLFRSIRSRPGFFRIAETYSTGA